MSDTHVNAFKMELAEKQAQLAALQGEVNALQRRVDSMEPVEAPATPAQPEATPAADPEVTKVDVKDGDELPQDDVTQKKEAK